MSQRPLARALATLTAIGALAAPALAQYTRAREVPRAHLLDYVDSTGAIATLPLDGGTIEHEMADVNGDGCPDIASVGDHGSPFINTQQHGVTLWLGDCAGGWSLVQVGDFGYGGLALGDADGDGLMDVGYGVHHNYSGVDLGDQILEVALGDGTGTSWTAWDDGLATNGEDWGMAGCDFGDVDGDGDLDLGSSSFGCCSGVHVYLNQMDGTWVQSFGFLGGNSDHDFLFADFNGDGHLDLVAANSLGRVRLGDGAGGFSAADGNLPGPYYGGIAAGDIDGDGRDELAITVNDLPQVWSWGAGNQWVSRTGTLPLIDAPAHRVQLSDMDADGDPELVTFGAGVLAVFGNDGGGGWWPAFLAEVPGLGSRPGVALRTGTDLDHNGYPDVSLVMEERWGFVNYRNAHRVYLEASAPAELSIRALSPTPSRVWRGGQARFVEWASAVPGADLGTVDLLLSTTGGSPPWTPLATGAPNGGRAQVLVPTGVQSTTCVLLYRVRTAATEERVQGPTFTILP